MGFLREMYMLSELLDDLQDVSKSFGSTYFIKRRMTDFTDQQQHCYSTTKETTETRIRCYVR